MKGPGVGAGMALVRDGRLLLIQRRRPPEVGRWSLPGGKVDFGEGAMAAAIREMAEELGVVVTGAALLGVADLIGEGEHWVSPIYLATAAEGEPALLEPEKHSAFGWFGLDTPPEPLAQSAITAISLLTSRDRA
ncbi:MAG TPA: NUDIX domain-containing protein [Caulobacteraceae bacterium]|jgi:ADP-ribose pyrophosphatase YjhB (NUDIX family)